MLSDSKGSCKKQICFYFYMSDINIEKLQQAALKTYLSKLLTIHQG